MSKRYWMYDIKPPGGRWSRGIVLASSQEKAQKEILKRRQMKSFRGAIGMLSKLTSLEIFYLQNVGKEYLCPDPVKIWR